MIASLRRIHRVAAPAAFAIAGLGLVLVTRSVSAPPEEARVVDVSGMELWASTDGRFRIGLQGRDAGGPRYLWLLPNVPLDAPDLLIYSIDPAEVETDASDLPKSARLLGSADSAGPSCSAVTEWPEAVALYSLGHAALVATLDLRAGEAR